MKKIDFLIKKLKEIGQCNLGEITDMFYEEYSEIIEQKKLEYEKKGENSFMYPFTESKLRNQIIAEFNASASKHTTLFNKDYITSPITWSLTEEGVKKYYELFSDEIEIPQEEVNEILAEEKIEIIENIDNIGCVYFMKSEIFLDTSKIGKGITVEGRVRTLDNDAKFYGFFKLKPVYFIKLKNYGKLEKTLHNYFDSLRISGVKNDIIEHNLPIE